MNISVLAGSLSSAPEVRTLKSGDQVVQLQVATRSAEVVRSVPVSMIDAPAWLQGLDAGAEVVVLGSVQRRFFSAGGSTGSRTEVVAQETRKA